MTDDVPSAQPRVGSEAERFQKKFFMMFGRPDE
jgi:hypothetical protein